jgi:transposase
MTGVMISNGRRPETEVAAKAKRRRYTAEYKARILREAAECAGERGGIAALLRREGLYSSHLTSWRQEAASGQRAALEPKKRGPKAKPVDRSVQRIAELERANRKLLQRAERAEALVELQKKVSEILGVVLPKPTDETDERSS